MCVMCSTSVPTLLPYFFYDHIPTFLYIFHEMFFITCIIIMLIATAAIDDTTPEPATCTVSTPDQEPATVSTPERATTPDQE